MHWIQVAWMEVPQVLVVLALVVWAEMEWAWIDGKEEAVGDAGCEIELVTQAADLGWNFAP